MIDWDRVSELQDEVGKDDFEEVVQLFLEEVEERIEGLPRIETPTDLEETLHFLKGSALNLGFDEFSALCQTGETASANGEVEEIDRPSIIACFVRSKQTFLSELKTRRAA